MYKPLWKIQFKLLTVLLFCSQSSLICTVHIIYNSLVACTALKESWCLTFLIIFSVSIQISSIQYNSNSSLTTVIALTQQIRYGTPPCIHTEAERLLLTQIRSMTWWAADRIGCHANSNHGAYKSVWIGSAEAACDTPHLWQSCLQKDVGRRLWGGSTHTQRETWTHTLTPIFEMLCNYRNNNSNCWCHAQKAPSYVLWQTGNSQETWNTCNSWKCSVILTLCSAVNARHAALPKPSQYQKVANEVVPLPKLCSPLNLLL